MVFPVVKKLLQNDERLLFLSASKVQKVCSACVGGVGGGWQWRDDGGTVQVRIAPSSCFNKRFLSTFDSRNNLREVRSRYIQISRYLEAEGRHLDVSVDVETVVLAGQHHAAVIHQRHVETLRVLHLQPNIFRYTGNIFWPEILSCETKYFLALQIIIIPYLALQRGDELAVLREDGQVEVVVVVSDGNLPGRVNADSDGVVGDACNKGPLQRDVHPLEL